MDWQLTAPPIFVDKMQKINESRENLFRNEVVVWRGSCLFSSFGKGIVCFQDFRHVDGVFAQVKLKPTYKKLSLPQV
jgi:hypothetical protein